MYFAITATGSRRRSMALTNRSQLVCGRNTAIRHRHRRRDAVDEVRSLLRLERMFNIIDRPPTKRIALAMGKETAVGSRSADRSLNTNNPWVRLPSRAPFILPGDLDNLSVIPVPYAGVPGTAQLVLLQLNPGLSPDEAELMNDPYYVEQNRKALTFESRVPFWPLDERLAGTPGHVYWKAKLRWLAAELGEDFVRERIFCAEFYPYHSKEFYGPRQPVPSQAFAFGLVRDTMKRGIPIIVM